MNNTIRVLGDMGRDNDTKDTISIKQESNTEIVPNLSTLIASTEDNKIKCESHPRNYSYNKNFNNSIPLHAYAGVSKNKTKDNTSSQQSAKLSTLNDTMATTDFKPENRQSFAAADILGLQSNVSDNRHPTCSNVTDSIDQGIETIRNDSVSSVQNNAIINGINNSNLPPNGNIIGAHNPSISMLHSNVNYLIQLPILPIIPITPIPKIQYIPPAIQLQQLQPIHVPQLQHLQSVQQIPSHILATSIPQRHYLPTIPQTLVWRNQNTSFDTKQLNATKNGSDIESIVKKKQIQGMRSISIFFAWAEIRLLPCSM